MYIFFRPVRFQLALAFPRAMLSIESMNGPAWFSTSVTSVCAIFLTACLHCECQWEGEAPVNAENDAVVRNPANPANPADGVYSWRHLSLPPAIRIRNQLPHSVRIHVALVWSGLSCESEQKLVRKLGN